MPDNNFTDGTLDNQLYDILVGLSEAGTYEPPSRDCFNDLTLDNQLYQILLAVGDISGGGGSGNIESINGDTTAAQVIAGTAPIGVATAAGTTTISSTQSGAATDGYLSSTDWNTFNNKIGAGLYTATTGLTMNTARLLGRTTAGVGAAEEISAGAGLTLSGGTLASTIPSYVLFNTTTTNAAVELFLDGISSRLLIPVGKVYGFNINIVATKDDGSAAAHYVRQYEIKNIGGTTSQVYAPVTIGSDNPVGTVINVTFDNTNDSLKIEATGITSETWYWRAYVNVYEVGI